jgi:hypothetical protein
MKSDLTSVPAGFYRACHGHQAGRHGDRYGHARLLIPALAVAALGMAAMMVLGSPVVIFAGMVLFGAGFDRERDVRAADRAVARG